MSATVSINTTMPNPRLAQKVSSWDATPLIVSPSAFASDFRAPLEPHQMASWLAFARTPAFFPCATCSIDLPPAD